MQEMVNDRRNADGPKEERYDLFNGLLDSTLEESDSSVAMSDEELIGKLLLLHRIPSLEVSLLYILGNMFIYLLAGHEVGSSPKCTVP
jgi:hypothetical protein